MNPFVEFCDLEIDWDLTPEDAVVMYMEQDDSAGAALLPPVRGGNAESRYFVVDTWDAPPTARLLERGYARVKELACAPVPEALRPCVREETFGNKGIFAPPSAVRAWLKDCVRPVVGESAEAAESGPEAEAEDILAAMGFHAQDGVASFFSGRDMTGGMGFPAFSAADMQTGMAGAVKGFAGNGADAAGGGCQGAPGLSKEEEATLLNVFFSQKTEDMFGGSAELHFLRAAAGMEETEEGDSGER